MSASSPRSPRPMSVASYQNSSPRLSSPLNPSPNSFSPPLPTGHTPRNSPTGEMSDTLFPLRERLDSRLTSSPRSPPGVVRPRTSSFSRSPRLGASPERSPVMDSMPLQPHRAYARHSSPSSSSFAQGVPFPSSSPLPSSPLAGPSQSPMSYGTCPLSPSSNSPRQRSPTSFHNNLSHVQAHPLCSPPHPTQSHFHLPQSSPVQVIPTSSSRFPRTQSLIQQSFGSQYAAQVASSPPDNLRNRRVSLGAESHQHPSTRASPVPASQLFIQDTSTLAKGDSTPLNEAPIRWWGGRRGWLDDWDNVVQRSQGAPYTANFSGSGEPDGMVAMRLAQPGYDNPSGFPWSFGRGRSGPGAFFDEEIRASFDGPGGVGAGLADPTTFAFNRASPDVNAGYEMERIPFPQAVPVPIAPRATASGMQNAIGYGGMEVGPPPVEGGFAMQRSPDDLAGCDSCHLHGNASGLMPDGTMSLQDQELGHSGNGHEHVGGRSRRFSNASTHSSTSYVSCMSGPSQSHSQSLLMSSSQSHTDTFPSLCSLGIGIEEAEREERRSRSFWARRSVASTLKQQSKDLGRSTGGCSEDVGQGSQPSRMVQHSGKGGSHPDDVEAERVDNGDAMASLDTHSNHSVTHSHEKDTMKHRSISVRIGSKHEKVSDEQAQQVGYNRAEECVSLAITSILPAATIAMLSPVGQALVRARDSAIFVGHELAPVVKDTLSVSADLLSCAPLPGIEEAAKALLSVWDACQKMDTNRLSCLRLAERCATLLYSVRCDIEETGGESTLTEPIERLCGALGQIQKFLNTQLHRPFLKRYLRREEIARELRACNDAITEAASRFGLSIQMRTYHQVSLAAIESKRFAQEMHAMLVFDHQVIQKMVREQQMQVQEDVVTEVSSTNLMPPPAYEPPAQPLPLIAGPILTTDQLPPTELLPGSGRNTPTLTMLSSGNPFDMTDSIVLAPHTPTPTKATFVVEKTTRTMTTKTETMATLPAPHQLMEALKKVIRAEDSADAADDEAALRGTMSGALDAHNDVEMVRCLQVARGEIPEAAETLRRTLDVGGMGVDRNTLEDTEHGMDMGNTELDRKFMQSGIEAMIRLTKDATEQPRCAGQNGGSGKGTCAVGMSELPSWTITRYEVIRTRKIGKGFFSDVYLGHWRKLNVIVKVLAHSVSREAFVRYVDVWNMLDHPNVLPLYGASSAVGEKPWFFVGKFCRGDNLVTSLKRARITGAMAVGDEATVRVDLLRFMYEISNGMAYLHGRGVLHGDLRATNVLVDENGQCVLSDFGQCEIKSEARRSCGQPEPHPIRWRAPEMLMGDDRPTDTTDVYAFAMCCIEILGMGDPPWVILDDRTIQELVLDKDERPDIPMLDGYADVANVVARLVQSCWVRQPHLRPSFSKITVWLEELLALHGHGSTRVHCASPPLNDIGPALAASTESSPADEHYETASESMRTVIEEENMDDMIDVSLTSPGPAFGNGHSVFRVNASNYPKVVRISTQVTSSIREHQDNDTPIPSPASKLDVDTRNEENYRLIAGSNHTFHNSLKLALWSPTRVELGAVGYLSKPKGEFITLFNAIDPLQSCNERLRQLPSLYGYGKLEIQRREEGKRSVAQRGLDAISGFLTFKTRGDRSHPERIARQYAFPLAQGKLSAHLCVEKTVHQYMDNLEIPMTWFKQHVDLILEVYTPRHAIQREDLILVIGTLDAPDWAVFVSDDRLDGRAQFNVFAGREKGDPWGMYTVEPAVKNGNTGPGRADVGQGAFASKVSCVSADVAGDTVMLAGLRFERGMQVPTEI